MVFPRTVEEMKEAGYQHTGSAPCNGGSCQAMMDWYKTPKGKNIPMDEGTATPHWETCPDRQKFKRGKGDEKEGGH